MIDTKEKPIVKRNSRTIIEIKKTPKTREAQKIRPTKFKKLFVFLIFALAAIISYLIINEEGTLELPEVRVIKLKKAVKRTEKRKHKKIYCEQYVLRAIKSAWYPLLHWGVAVAKDSIWLNKNEVWKYGITCVGELRRYPGQIYYSDGNKILNRFDLVYVTQFKGTEKECKIEEKRKIYNYPLLLECVARKIKLERPPGCKNDN